jgi:hypothetical protein
MGNDALTELRIVKGLLFPKGDQHRLARLIFGFVANVGLAIYMFFKGEHLYDIRDYRYMQIDTVWLSVMSVVPVAVLFGLLPVVSSSRTLYRWLAIGLSVLPAYLAAATWFQWVAR